MILIKISKYSVKNLLRKISVLIFISIKILRILTYDTVKGKRTAVLTRLTAGATVNCQ